MVDLTISNIPDNVMITLETMAVSRNMTVEDLVLEMICQEVIVAKPAQLIEITEEQFRQNIDVLLAAYDRQPIAIVDEKGRRFVMMPIEKYKAGFD
ncbi:hypothetical protein SAMN04488117_12138 [Celeribacter baekdonensis]|uniref:Antitoxin n=1 Tax=Celeribacter baekdonensis TaxID=875171 RepID=A0A1G7UDY8_9RHOB|nr:hypothetical protein [Celeribacter baekdonensis]SDG45289.1 hypothetical protein SAMN04488117_12138 [Celeribacter baekdonensis]